MSDQLAEAVVSFTTTGFEKVKSAISSVHSALEKLGFTAQVVGAVGLGASIAYAVKKYADFEATQRDLRDALEVSGQAVERNMARFSQLGSAIAQLTPVSKGETNELLELALAHGKSADEAARLAATSIGLGKALRVSASEAMDLLARQDDRAFTALGRLNSQIAAATTNQEKLDVVNRLAAQGMKQLEGSSDTIKGAMAQLGQIVGGVYTKIGSLLAPVIRKLIEHFKDSALWMNQLIDTMIAFGFHSGNSFNQVGSLMTTLGNTINKVFAWIHDRIKDAAYYLLNWGDTWNLVVALVAEYTQKILDRWDWFKDAFVSYGKWMADSFEKIWDNMLFNVQSKMAIFTLRMTAAWERWKASHSFMAGNTDAADSLDAVAQGMENVGGKKLLSGVGDAPELAEFKDSMTTTILEAHTKGAIEGANKARPGFEKLWDSFGKKSKVEVEKWLNGVVGKVALATQNEKTKETKKGSEFGDLIGVWKHAQAGALNDPAMQISRAQLQELKNLNRNLQRQKQRKEEQGRRDFAVFNVDG